MHSDLIADMAKCADCGKDFEPRTHNHIYCSEVCKRRASYRRNELKVRWHNMKRRCYDSDYYNYKNYGMRGIIVCEEWLNDQGAFVSWAKEHGFRPGLTLDRIDNDGPYSPDNCRFVTPRHSLQHKRKVTTDYEKGTRICATCGAELPLSKFVKDNRAAGGRGYQCRTCNNAYHRNYRRGLKA